MTDSDHNQSDEPTIEKPVTHLMIPLNYDRTGCCSKPLRGLPTDRSHLVTNRPLYKTCDGTGRVRGEVSS